MSNQVTSIITTDKEVANNELRISIRLRTNGFSFLVATTEQELLTFGEADFDFHQPVAQLSEAIKEFFAVNGIATFGCKELRLIVPSDHFAWVPEHLYDSVRDRQYIKMTSQPAFQLGVFHAYSSVLQSYIVFTAPAEIVTAFKVALPGIDVVNQHWVLVNDELLMRSEHRPVVLMHVRNGAGDYEACYNKQLLMSNSFAADNDNELMYHALDVMKTLHLETPDMELAICGNVGREIYGQLQRFFPNVSLYTGSPIRYSNPAFQTFHTYQHALLLS